MKNKLGLHMPVSYYIPDHCRPDSLNGATDKQILALVRVYHRQWDDKPESFLAFARTAQRGYDCVMVPWCGMWLGIETDGYTHS